MIVNYLRIPPGSTGLHYEWVSPDVAATADAGSLYRLTIQKQPGLFLASAVAGNLGVIDRVVVRGDIAGISLVAVLDRLSGGVNVDVLLPALEIEVRSDDDDAEKEKNQN